MRVVKWLLGALAAIAAALMFWRRPKRPYVTPDKERDKILATDKAQKEKEIEALKTQASKDVTDAYKRALKHARATGRDRDLVSFLTQRIRDQGENPDD